jgi:multiple sugar transport system permease protein
MVDLQIKTRLKKIDVKKLLNFRSMKRMSKFKKIITFIMLTLLGYVFLYPMLRMLSFSMMSIEDLTNPSVNWIPTTLYLENFKMAFSILDYFHTLLQSIYVSLVPSIFQVISTALVGYGLARYEFKGRKLILVLVLVSFIVIPQITSMPQYLMYKNLGIIGTIFSLILPALFGQGIKSAIFVLIFFRFFSMMPKAIEEAARIDGASDFQIFIKVAVPSALPAFIIVFLFSFVWYWNDTYTISMFTDGITTFPMQLESFSKSFEQMFNTAAMQKNSSGIKPNEAIEMAGTLLSIIPLLVLYAFTERYFVESADNSGLTGE